MDHPPYHPPPAIGDRPGGAWRSQEPLFTRGRRSRGGTRERLLSDTPMERRLRPVSRVLPKSPLAASRTLPPDGGSSAERGHDPVLSRTGHSPHHTQKDISPCPEMFAACMRLMYHVWCFAFVTGDPRRFDLFLYPPSGRIAFPDYAETPPRRRASRISDHSSIDRDSGCRPRNFPSCIVGDQASRTRLCCARW